MDYDLAPPPQLPPLHEHPFYAAGMGQMSAGQWQQALQTFQVLLKLYPDDAEVKELLEQAQMRAPLATFQPRPTSRVTKRLTTRRLIIWLVGLIIFGLAAYVIYTLWIDPVILQGIRQRQITQLREEADAAIVAGDYARAQQALQRLQALRPGNSQTDETLSRIQDVERMLSLYDQARTQIDARSWDEAIQTLTELEGLDPDFRELPELLQVAQEAQAKDQRFQAAEEAFAGANYAGAIAQFEALQQADLAFRFEEVQARLFEAHLRYGQALMEKAGADPEQVSQAITHLAEALKLSPLDSSALKERNLAESYLAALQSQNQDEVIERLLTIHKERPEYAGKQAAQRLYTALLERAQSSLSAGDKEAAIADYQLAAELPVEDPSQAQQELVKLTSPTDQ